ncbi:unnamed protein product [Paramecium primaurelia]|uniref:GB1/RHD3-type G domain-containing protein n=1 Tax=Paramecium primaurelia TaxID=5886 RepID=A0A8S1LE06_PARPR|nr:unnamed protein product [Paramecium primaurelia]
MKKSFKEEAMPLIFYQQETQTYQVNPDAIEIIKNIPSPIGIVGVAGMYRTGKSYLLNRMLLNRSDGFGVGPTVLPCTKGLWMWGKPLLGQTSDGESCSILVVDSEGLGAPDEDSTHDIRIFSLTILLTSCFIYNSVGSIDENALQNLSLVVNLTKNIQLKSGQSLQDLEDLSQYFPQFYWVVRDFTLQLVDKNREQITSKDYLENALLIQKGSSDGIDQKNKIRKLLTAFFKDRDCITLVRPLTEESSLQNLENLDFDKLRPEFFEQVINLRKKILNRIRPKILNGKTLSGQMYCDLIRSYVTAINNGAVPAIESAWTYICKNECQKAVAEAFDTYEQILKENLHNRFPISNEDLKAFNRSLKEQAFALLKKKCVGDADEYKIELSRRIKQRFAAVKQENDREGSRMCSQFIQQEFQPIDRKLKLGEYKSFGEYEKDIKMFYNFFIENGPRVGTRNQIILEFLQRALIEGSNLFIRQYNQETDMMKNVAQETQKKLEQELKEVRQDSLKDKNNLLMKLAQVESEKSDLELREQVARDNLEELKIQKEQVERDLKLESENEKIELTRQIQELKGQVIKAEEYNKDMERNTLFGNSEFEKERALLEQKITFFEKLVNEMNTKELEYQNEIKNLRKEHSLQSKDQQTKSDQMVRQLQQKLSDLQEKLNEMENELIEKESNFENDFKKFEHKERSLTKQNFELNEQIQGLTRELREYRRNEEQMQQMLKNDANNQVNELLEKVQGLEDLIKTKDDQLKQTKSHSEKDKALMQQKMEFMEVQLDEYKKQIEENKKSHDAIMKAFENSSNESTYKIDAAKMNDLREQHKKDLKNIENEYESVKKRLQQQVDQLNERNSELELKVKFETGDLIKEIENLKEQLQTTEEQRNKLLEQNKTLDGQKLSILKEQELRYQKKIKSLEQAMDEADTKTAREVNQAQAKAEESLTQLKNFYEIERERLERRICEEKEKSDKKFQAAQEEFYHKLRETEQNYEEEIETLKDDLRDQVQQYTNTIQQYDHEIALKQQTIEIFEKHIKEIKEQLISLQNNNNATLEQQMNSFTTERKSLISKIDVLSSQLNNLQKEHMALQQKKDLLENEKTRKEQQFEQTRKEWQEEKRELIDRFEETKSRLQKMNDEFLEKKIEYGRETALTQQQNEFLQKKIEDLQKQIDTQQSRFDEKIKQQKNEYSIELEQKLERAQEEKTAIETKYDKIKKQLKESEYQYNKQASTLEREKAILTEKLGNLESRKNELESKIKDESASVAQQQAALREQIAAEKKSLQQELEKYKQFNLQLEQEKSEIHTSYERDKALWEGKFQFLEQQKEQAKQDLVDALKKFEMTLMHLQRARSNEKDEQENNLNELLLSVERKYQSQIEEANQTHQRIVQDYEDKIRRLQKEVKTHKDKILIDQHGKIGNQLLSEKKFAEMLDNEKRLQQEIENIKQDRDQKIFEYQKMLEQERENLKAKLVELETKYKDVESKRSTLIFEFEKERAKWNLDRDHLNNIKNELSDQLEKLGDKKEQLLRENEKLKNEQRATRRSVAAHNMTTNNIKTGNTYRNPINNISTIGLQKLSPTHSNNTSTSSANISVLKKNNLADITNYEKTAPLTQQSFQNSKFYFYGNQQGQNDDSMIGQSEFQK